MQGTKRGFTLIETMVAISILMLALIAPMSLATESLTVAFYARNQITAFYLAQEGIEIVRSVRDSNIITAASGQSVSSIFAGIPQGTTASDAPLFTVDSLQTTSNALDVCASSGPTQVCPPLQTDGSVYGYPSACYSAHVSNGTWQTSDCAGTDQNWKNSTFTRSIKAYPVNGSPHELRVSVTVTWQQGSFSTRSVIINEDLYKWVNIGS